MKDAIKAAGRVKITVRGPDGNIKDEQTVKNLVVQDGLDFIAERIKSSAATPAPMSHMALGTSEATVLSTDSALIQSGTSTEKLRSSMTATVDGDETKYEATFAAHTSGGTFALKEAGLFNHDTTGTMLARTIFDAINKQEVDTVNIEWTVSLADS